MNEHDENGVKEDMNITEGVSIELDTEVVENAIEGTPEDLISPDAITFQEPISEATIEEAEEVTQEAETVVIPASPDVVEQLDKAVTADVDQTIEEPVNTPRERFLF